MSLSLLSKDRKFSESLLSVPSEAPFPGGSEVDVPMRLLTTPGGDGPSKVGAGAPASCGGLICNVG